MVSHCDLQTVPALGNSSTPGTPKHSLRIRQVPRSPRGNAGGLGVSAPRGARCTLRKTATPQNVPEQVCAWHADMEWPFTHRWHAGQVHKEHSSSMWGLRAQATASKGGVTNSPEERTGATRVGGRSGYVTVEGAARPWVKLMGRGARSGRTSLDDGDRRARHRQQSREAGGRSLRLHPGSTSYVSSVGVSGHPRSTESQQLTHARCLGTTALPPHRDSQQQT